MFCGKYKQYLQDIKIKDLIKIFKPYEDLSIKVSGSEGFYLNFDQSGDYIDITHINIPRMYGMEGKYCKSNCELYDSVTGCKCTGENCVTDSLYKNLMDKASCKVEVSNNDDTESYQVELVHTEKNKNGIILSEEMLRKIADHFREVTECFEELIRNKVDKGDEKDG